MNHLHHFPHSHGHLFSFGLLAITMAFITVNTVVAEEAPAPAPEPTPAPAEVAPAPAPTPTPTEVVPIPSEASNIGNNQPPHDFKPQQNFEGQPVGPNQPFVQPIPGGTMEKDFKPMNDNLGKPEFGQPPHDFKPQQNFEGQPKFDGQGSGFEGKNFGPNNMGNMGPNSNGPMMKDGPGPMMNGDGQDQQGQNEQFDQQMIKNAQLQIRQIEQQIRQFEKRAQSITKQGLALPAEFSASLAKVKAIVAAVKNAKTADELEAAGMDDLRDEMGVLFENHKLLEQLAQWPRILKMVDRQIASETRSLKRYKTLADKLEKKGVDVSLIYSELEAAVNSLKTGRDEAVAKVAAGDVETAFEILEEKFYETYETLRDKQGIMQTMSNLGQFATEFKKAQRQMSKVISDLKKRKIDTAELVQLQTAFNQKGQTVQQLIKARPIDMEAIRDTLEELFESKQEFMDKMEALDSQSGGDKSNSDFSF